VSEGTGLPRRALVLGGGGITGIAWEIGLLYGLAEADADVTDAELVIGTSAGSIVGAQITSGRSLEELYRSQLEPPAAGRVQRLTRVTLARYAWAQLRSRGRAAEFGRRMGRLAIRAADAGRAVTAADFRQVISASLPRKSWPRRDLLTTAVDAVSGEFRTFGVDDEVPLVEAVAASCAVPGVFAPILINGRRYIDGGMRTPANADLARGCDRVVALTPIARVGDQTPLQLAALGVRFAHLAPDPGSLHAIGKNVLDPAARAATVRAGRAQAAAERDRVIEIWNGPLDT
jgi:NTE family protein